MMPFSFRKLYPYIVLKNFSLLQAFCL
jgi:hypothetical protein